MIMLPEWIAKASKKGYTREEYVSKFWKVRPGSLGLSVCVRVCEVRTTRIAATPCIARLPLGCGSNC